MIIRKLLQLLFCILWSIGIYSQDLSTAKSVEENNDPMSNYTGEYQWFVPDEHLKWFEKLYATNPANPNQYGLYGDWTNDPGEEMILSYKIELVGFPFIIDSDPTSGAVVNATERNFNIPSSQNYHQEMSNSSLNLNPAFNWNSTSGWTDLPYLDPANVALFQKYGEVLNTDVITARPNSARGSLFGDIVNRPSTLISKFHTSTSGNVGDAINSDNWRINYPHSALKHTLYLHCGDPGANRDENIIDSISFVIDHTWVANTYPYNNDNHNNSVEIEHDAEVISVLRESWLDPSGTSHLLGNHHKFDDDLGDPYYINKFIDLLVDPAISSNGSFSAIDYFKSPGDVINCTPVNSEPSGGYQNSLSSGFDPYDHYRIAPNSNLILDGTFREGFSSKGVPHKYTIDRPIDLTIINSSEKVIYNPREVNIDLQGTLTLPSGYRFITAHKFDFGQPPTAPENYNFPTVSEVMAAKSFMESNYIKSYEDLRDVPADANQVSIYRIKSGSTLEIEDCAEMFDVEIIVESGAILDYNSETVIIRNVTITNQGGTVTDRASTATCFDKNNDDCRFHYPNGINITQNTTWNNEDLYIRGKVSISNGAVLTITNSTLRFADSDEIGAFSGIEVGTGCRLNVNGSTLDAVNFCPSKWSGIIAKGRTAYSHDPGGGGTRLGSSGGGGSGAPAYVEINDSQIRNAYKGIWAVSNTSLVGGALLDISKTDFLFNLVDIKMDHDIYYESSSIIDDCLFASNDWFKTPYSKTSNIEVSGINGLRIINSEFVNGSVNNSSTYSSVVGVQISESELTISGNTFRGLEKALEISNEEKNIVISSNAFTRNRQNLLVNTAGNIELRNNASALNPNSQTVFNNFFNATTVAILSAAEIDIRENNMDKNGVTGNITAFRFPDLSNSTSNLIFDNSINNYDVGIFVSGADNMEISCNAFHNYETAIEVENSTFSQLTSSSGAARNKFVPEFRIGHRPLFVNANSSFVTYIYSENNLYYPHNVFGNCEQIDNPNASHTCPGDPVINEDDDHF